MIFLVLQLPVSPSKSDHLAREREDVNKLVTDLIGGSSLTPTAAAVAAASATPTALQRTPEHATPTKPAQQVSARPSRPVKLVVDQLAPVNIRPKVSRGSVPSWRELHSDLCDW